VHRALVAQSVMDEQELVHPDSAHTEFIRGRRINVHDLHPSGALAQLLPLRTQGEPHVWASDFFVSIAIMANRYSRCNSSGFMMIIVPLFALFSFTSSSLLSSSLESVLCRDLGRCSSILS
jgi:hypothetical protein